MSADEELYCICQQPDDHKFMISCDRCSGWFHGRCVGMTKEKSRRLPEWVCPNCAPAQPENPKLEGIDISSNPVIYINRVVENEGAASENKDLSSKRRRTDEPKSAKKAKTEHWNDNPVRRRVVEAFCKVLSSASASDETNSLISRAEPLSVEIEQNMYDVMANPKKRGQDAITDAYRSKFQTLHFNLKKPGSGMHVAMRLLKKELMPSELIHMGAEDFVDDKERKEIESLRQESLRGSILTAAQAAVILKKTHKGEVVIKQDTLAGDEDGATTETASELAAESKRTSVSEQGARADQQTNVDSLLSVISPVSPVNQASSVDLLDSILAKVDHVSHPTSTETLAEDMSEQAQTAKEEEKEEGDGKIKFRKDPKWFGHLAMESVGEFDGAIIQTAGPGITTHQFYELLSSKLRIDGRINPTVVNKYVNDMLALAGDSRDVVIGEVYPSDESQREGFDQVFDYFRSKDRYAVIPVTSGKSSTFGKVKDFYLVPLDANDELPEFLETVMHEIPIDRKMKLFLAVIVSTRPSKAEDKPKETQEKVSAPATTSTAATSVPETASAPAIDPKITEALSLLNSLVPTLDTLQPGATQPPPSSNVYAPQQPMQSYFPGMGGPMPNYYAPPPNAQQYGMPPPNMPYGMPPGPPGGMPMPMHPPPSHHGPSRHGYQRRDRDDNRRGGHRGGRDQHRRH